MANCLKFLGDRPTDTLRRRIRLLEVWEFGLQLHQVLQQFVESLVGYLCLALLVVEVVVVVDFGGQLLNFLFCFHCSHDLNINAFYRKACPEPVKGCAKQSRRTPRELYHISMSRWFLP